jgi:methylase of polypeptide subunit release factors
MKLDDFNVLLKDLDSTPGREQVMKTAFAFLDWMGIKPHKEGKEKLLAPKKEELKRYLTRHPITNQFQLYRLSADDEAITVRFAFLKKFRKDQITQLIDKESIVHFQGAPPIIQTLPSAPAYTFHIIAPAEQNRIFIILNKGDQKRIVSFRKKLTQTQFQKIVPQWQNMGTKSKPEIAEQLWKSLDIKEVNKEFYKQIKEQFDALVGIAKTQAPKINEEEAKQFAVRLIGRYIFCWFLKEKGIISETLLASSTIRQHKKDFFQKYLYQLFFNTLNEEVQSRNPFKGEGGLEALYDTIPYLNGGLFEKHPEDKLFGVLDLNAWLIVFVGVIEDFDFTVDESSSQYQQVAIDPEMLGRIFENLLASQNPETEKMANQRKAFGAFYTPREIVDYMVNQALKSYLEEALLPKDEAANLVEEPLVEYKGTLFQDMEPQQTLFNFDPAKKAIADQRRKRLQEHLDKFFSPECSSHPFDKGDVPIVQQKLSEVKILDPACGSGAFPMGVLLRLMELRQLVGHGHRNNYDLKSEILSRNIYGVDIMPMAVEIARLRAWLSLVLEAEYKPQDRKNNFGVSALPNLDFKFVCANSLINVPEDDYVTNMAVNEIALFERLTSQYFSASRHEKVTLKEQIKETINSITQIHDIAIDRLKLEVTRQQKSGDKGKVKKMLKSQEEFEHQHKLWQSYKNIFENKTVGFFTIRYFFPSIKNGFDVVIGNPPYVLLQDKVKDELEISYFKSNFKSAVYKVDLYHLFLEKGLTILKEKAILCFITPSNYLSNNYNKTLRDFLIRSSTPKEIINISDTVFEASVDTAISLFVKGTNLNSTVNYYKGKFDENGLSVSFIIRKKKKDILKDNNLLLIPADSLETEDLLRKIEEAEVKLGDIAKVNFGMQLRDRKVYTGDVVESVDGNGLTTYHKKCLTGKDINPYLVEYHNLYCYFNVEAKRGGCWDEDIHFKKGKILIRQIGETPIAGLDEFGYPVLNSAFMLNSELLPNKYILGILNSSVIKTYWRNKFSDKRKTFPKIKGGYLELIPIKEASKTYQNRIIELVETIILEKKLSKDTIHFERQINILVSKLYKLTYSEVKIIDSEFWLSEEAYNNYK